MSKRLLDIDPVTKIASWFEYDDLTDDTTISYTGGDLDAQVEASKDLQNDDEYTRKGMKNDALHYAHIPDMILLKWKFEGVDITNKKELFRKVNEPEYSYLKTTKLVHKAKG